MCGRARAVDGGKKWSGLSQQSLYGKKAYYGPHNSCADFAAVFPVELSSKMFIKNTIVVTSIVAYT